ncbi:MAG TPA: hypothetical protein VMW17_12165 [Candidatus Binatia bacterium]|nr:hypothetical protein [Candidatus Binatia bacterium]
MVGHRLCVAIGMAGVVWLGNWTGLARAQTTTTEAASVLVFPRVVVTGSWDTIIQIGNNANRPANARCYYANGTIWAPTNFSLAFHQQQPTHWVASRGRALDPNDQECGVTNNDCDGAGFDPGAIPALDAPFAGELRCIEVDASGAPWTGNALSGVATLMHRTSGEIVKYPAVGLHGLETNDADTSLCLGGDPRVGCLHGAEYAGCPKSWIVSHPADFDDRSFDGDARSTSITVVPCSEDFGAAMQMPLLLQFRLTNEFEETFSAATTITCWADLHLSDISTVFQRDTIGSNWLQTTVRAAGDNSSGFILTQQSTRETAFLATFAAAGTVPPHETEPLGSDIVGLPEEVGQ